MRTIFLIVGIIASALCCSTLLAEELQGKKVVMSDTTDTVILGGGCFWCVEAVFQSIKGVTAVESGYAGGSVVNPTYDQVSSGKSGHAEVAKITYDPKVISYEELLEVFLCRRGALY